MLSVVIPVYRQLGALRRTLGSLAAQSMAPDDFEVVITDDASPAPVADVVAEAAGTLRVRVVRHEVNRGRAAARNTAARAAEGDVLVFLDSDSVAHSKLLERHATRHAQHDGERVVLGRRVESDWGTATTFGDPAALTVEVPADQEDTRTPYWIEDDGYRDSSPWQFLHSHNFSLSRRVFTEVDGFDEEFKSWGWEDTELAYRLHVHWARQPGRFLFARDAVCYHVPHYVDMAKNWVDARTGLAHLKAKHEHYEVERLGEYPRMQVLTQAKYKSFFAHPQPAELAREAEAALPPVDRRLWAGPGWTGLRQAPVATLDISSDRSATNKHLLGIDTPWPDGHVDDAVHWQHWRILTGEDLSAVLRESNRLGSVTYLAGTVHDDGAHRLAQPADVRVALENSPYTAEEVVRTDSVWVLRIASPDSTPPA